MEIKKNKYTPTSIGLEPFDVGVFLISDEVII